MTDVLDTINDIIAMVKDTGDGKRALRLRGVGYFEDAVTDGAVAVTDAEGTINPYMVITFGNRSPAQLNQQGIVAPGKDLKRIMFGVEVYARDAAEVRRVHNDVINVIEGYTPLGAGVITQLNSGPVTNPIQFDANQTRDGAGIIFTCLANTIG